jgi:hypothetical protein
LLCFAMWNEVITKLFNFLQLFPLLLYVFLRVTDLKKKTLQLQPPKFSKPTFYSRPFIIIIKKTLERLFHSKTPRPSQHLTHHHLIL